MRRLGLIGGLSWESTATYYRIINEEVRNRFGNLHSAPMIVNSLDFERVDALARSGKWDEAGAILVEAAGTLERAGAEGLVLCCNLMHYVAPRIEASVSIPLLHIGDAILGELRSQGLNRIGLLGTSFTLENHFVLDRPLRSKRWGIPQILIPEKKDRTILDQAIYGHLCRGLPGDSFRPEFLRMTKDLRERGVNAVVLVATVLAKAFKPEDFYGGWLFDSMELHALMAARWSINEEKLPDFSQARFSDTAGARLAKERSRSSAKRGGDEAARCSSQPSLLPKPPG